MRAMLLALVGLMMLSLPAYAEEKAAETGSATSEGAGSFVYSPDDCEFTITFPTEPYTSQRCNPADPKKCSDVTSFTKVYGMDASLNMHVSCYKAEDGMYDRYTGDVMKTVLIGMSKSQNLDGFESDYIEYKEAKLAVLIGSGLSDNGQHEMLYSAQLWIGKNSVFTLEGEVSGQSPEADRQFAEILKTVKAKAGVFTPADAPGAGNAGAAKAPE